MTAKRKSGRATARPRGPSHLTGGKQAILVLGMHRSGTSALTRALSLLGADLPKNVMGPGIGNETGHWESSDLVVIHDDMLASAGSSWHDWRAISADWMESSLAAAARQRLLAVIERDYSQSGLFTVKDPRICRFVPLWLDVLVRFGATPVPILPIRNPLEVAASLRRRDGFALTKSYLLWLRHVLDAEQASRDLPRAIVSYDMLLDDWRTVAARISANTGLRWPRRSDRTELEVDRFLAEAHRHHVTDEAELQARGDVADWVKETYGILRTMSRGPEQAAHHRVLDRIRAEFDKAAAAFGLLLAGETENAETRVRDADARTKAALDERDAAAAALIEREARLAEARSALQQAQQQVTDHAVRLRTLEDELVATRGRAHQVESAAATQRQDIERLQHELEAARSLLRDSQTEAQRLGGDVAQATEQLLEVHARIDAMTAEREAARADLDAKHSAFNQAEARAKEAEAKADAGRRDLDLLSRKLEASRHLLQARDTETERLREEIAQAEQRRRDAEAQVAVIAGEHEKAFAAMRVDHDRIRRELTVTQSMLRDARRDTELANAALSNAQQSLRDITQERTLLAQELARAAAVGATAAAGIQELETARDTARRAADEAAQTHQEFARLRETLRQTQSQLQRDIATRDERTAGLQRALDSLRSEAEALRAKQQAEERQRLEKTLTRPRGLSWPRLWRRSATARQRWEFEAIRTSGLFDPVWYLMRYPDVAAAGQDPLTHYVLHGGAEGRDPHPLFDGKWYLEQYPDDARRGISPLGHYLLEGAAKGCDPNPLFDTDWYSRENKSFLTANDNPLAHFWKTGASNGLDPNPLFDVTWYLHEYRDVSQARENALVHYATHGWREGRNPNPYFDTTWYAKSYMTPGVSNLNPLAYYLRFGLALGHETNPDRRYPSGRRLTNLPAVEMAYDRLAVSSPWEQGLQQQAHAAKTREILVLGDIDAVLSQPLEGVCVYMIHSDRPCLYSRHELVTETFAKIGYAVVIINNCDLYSSQFAQSARTKSDAVIVRKNVGRDFGAWVDFIAQHYRSLAKTKSVILMNDSVLGPTSKLQSALDKINRSDDHIIGLSESHQNGYHVQSSFLYLKPSLFWDERFLSWIAIYPHPEDKSEVIRLGEIGLSKIMIERGLNVRSLINYQDAAVAAAQHAGDALNKGELGTEESDYYQTLINDIDHGVPRNPQHAFWNALLKLGYPFVKRELFTVNPEGVPQLSEFRAILQADKKTIACIEDEISRTIARDIHTPAH